MLENYPLGREVVEYTILEGVKSIRQYAFCDAINLQKVTIPNSIEVIGDYEFLLCQSLEIITIPNSVISIGAHCYQNCQKLKTVSVGEGLFSIGKNFGLDTASVAAVLASGGVALGLALQGSLSNFAGGVLILILKPFRIGDYIIANGMEGTVIGIDIFYTKLRTGDNRVVVLPNGTLSNSDLINASQEPIRRVDLVASVDYESDIRMVKSLLFEIATDLSYSLKGDEEHPIQVYVDSFGDSAINVGLRFWVNAGDYWAAKWEANEQIKDVFDKAGISIPFNQLDVMIKNK